MLAQVMLTLIGVFCLVESGCKKGYLTSKITIITETHDPPETLQIFKWVYRVEHLWRLANSGAGDRPRPRQTDPAPTSWTTVFREHHLVTLGDKNESRRATWWRAELRPYLL
jgi:hypothetical protein